MVDKIFHFIMHHWVIILVLIISYISLDALFIVIDAALEVKKRPTEPMAWCHKHGAFRKKHTLPLFPQLGGTAENANVCPMCYKETVFDNIRVK